MQEIDRIHAGRENDVSTPKPSSERADLAALALTSPPPTHPELVT